MNEQSDFFFCRDFFHWLCNQLSAQSLVELTLCAKAWCIVQLSNRMLPITVKVFFSYDYGIPSVECEWSQVSLPFDSVSLPKALRAMAEGSQRSRNWSSRLRLEAVDSLPAVPTEFGLSPHHSPSVQPSSVNLSLLMSYWSISKKGPEKNVVFSPPLDTQKKSLKTRE